MKMPFHFSKNSIDVKSKFYELINNFSNDTQALNTIADYTFKEYTTYSTQRQMLHMHYIRVYVTISSLLIGALFSVLTYFHISNQEILNLHADIGKAPTVPENQLIQLTSWGEIGVVLILLSILVAGIVFVIAVDLLKGRHKQFVLLDELATRSNNKINYSNNENSYNYNALLKDLAKINADALHESSNYHIHVITALQRLSRLLVLSVFLGISGSLLLLFF